MVTQLIYVFTRDSVFRSIVFSSDGCITVKGNGIVECICKRVSTFVVAYNFTSPVMVSLLWMEQCVQIKRSLCSLC